MIPVGKGRISWRMVIWLTAVWVMLWADFTVANILIGLVIGAVVTLFLPLPTIDFRGRIHPLPAINLVAQFLIHLVLASFQVALLALNPRRVPTGAVIRVHLRNESDLYLTLTSQLTTLIPGSIVVEANRQTGVLYLHMLDAEALGGIEKMRADTLAQEERVMRALATDDELEAAGISRRRRTRQEARS